MKRTTELKRKTPLQSKRGLTDGGQGQAPKTTAQLRRTPLKRSRGISPASPAQRKKAQSEPCIVTATTAEWNTVDPAHLWPAARGGCKDPLCIVPLAREVHERFDNQDFDLLPYLVKRRVPELCHALEHAEGDLIGLLQRLTGCRWSPE